MAGDIGGAPMQQALTSEIASGNATNLVSPMAGTSPQTIENLSPEANLATEAALNTPM